MTLLHALQLRRYGVCHIKYCWWKDFFDKNFSDNLQQTVDDIQRLPENLPFIINQK